MIFYAVIDTNVLVSALLARHEDSATVQVVDKVFTGEIIPVYSDMIVQEYQKVLHRDKFHFSAEKIDTLISVIIGLGSHVLAAQTQIILPDMSDLPFYSVAIKHDYIYLITGNQKHFPQEPFIVSPREMLDIIKKG